MKTTRILVLSDDRNINEAIADVLDNSYCIHNVPFSAPNIQNVFKMDESKVEDIDLILLNLSSITSDMANLLSKFNTFFQSCPIIVLHHFSQKVFADAFIEWGAKAYLPINFEAEELNTAVEEVQLNRVYISKKLL